MDVVEPVEPVETVEPAETGEAVDPIASGRRSRTTMIAVTAGVIVAAGLVAYGFAQSDDDRDLDTDTPPTIGVIQAPAEVFTTDAVVVIPGSAPTTDNIPIIPDETVDIGAPPISSNIVVP